MQAMEAAKLLSQAIQDSPEYQEFAKYKAEIDGDSGIKGLVQEYHRMQTALQMRVLSGQGMDGEAQQRFQQLSMLLFADQRTSSFLMAEMRMQQMMAGIFEALTKASGLDLPTPM